MGTLPSPSHLPPRLPPSLTFRRRRQLKLSEEAVLRAFHPDGPAAYNACMDVRAVLRELLDPTARMRKRVRGAA